MATSATRELIDRVWGIRFERLRAEQLNAVRTLMLDHLGVAIRGSMTQAARTAQVFVRDMPSTSSTSLPLLGTPWTASPLYASFANAVAGHSIEYDDVHNGSSTHPGVVIFPAAFAASAMAGAEEATFVLGVIVGYEVMCRVGRAANPVAHYRRHFHPTGTTGHFGAAATASVILGLGAETTVSSLGIAGTMAAGNMAFLTDGAWTKPLHPGLAARNGVEAALLAARGFQGPSDAIAGEHGFLAAYSDDPKPELLLAGWPEASLEIERTSIKAHACCRYNQGPIDALLQIRAGNLFSSSDVVSVTVGVPAAAIDIVSEPVERKRRPESIVDAQFSLPYAAAVALLRGRAGLAEYDGTLLSDTAVRSLMDTVTCVTDPEIERYYPNQWRAWAMVATRDGHQFEAEIPYPQGDPENPFSLQELRAKFEDLTSTIYTPDRRAAIAGAVGKFGEPGSLKELLDLLPVRDDD